jgi:phage-related protein
MVPVLEPIFWMGDSLARLRALPADVRWDAGGQLERVQSGQNPDDFRPVPDVGPGTMEVRLHVENEYRVFYVARFEEAVYVLHCFVKKTRTSREADIDLGRRRYRAMLEYRKGGQAKAE